MTDIRLSDSSVTTSAINLAGAEITYKWNNFVETNPIVAKFDSASDPQSEVHFMGWTNPTYNITGILDTGSTASATVTFALLKSFAKSTTSTYLFDDLLCPTGSLVKITDFAVPRLARERGIYNYSINLIETI